MVAPGIYNGLREVSAGVLYGEGRRSEGLRSSPEDNMRRGRHDFRSDARWA